jgi:hypothetical protein
MGWSFAEIINQMEKRDLEEGELFHIPEIQDFY